MNKETPPPPKPAADFRHRNVISWQTTLIMPEDRFDALAPDDASVQAVSSNIAESALVFGYQFVNIGLDVFEVIPPATPEDRPILRITEMSVENGDFVSYVIVRPADNQPMCSQGRPVVFVNPAVARMEAARNAGEVKRADVWAKEARKQAESRIITAATLPPSLTRGDLVTARR